MRRLDPAATLEDIFDLSGLDWCQALCEPHLMNRSHSLWPTREATTGSVATDAQKYPDDGPRHVQLWATQV
eukprot:8424553-Pyramimonas_sp.AAC.1